MKYIIGIIVFIFCLFTCNSHKVKNYNQSTLDSLYLYYDSLPSRFNLETFHENGLENNFHNFYTSDSILIKQIITNTGYTEIKEFPYGNLIEQKNYDTTGILRERYTYLKDSTLVGKYFIYKEDGKLISVEEFNVGFQFHNQRVLNFMDSLNIHPNQTSYGLIYDEELHLWYWQINERTSYYTTREFYLDTNTGIILWSKTYSKEENIVKINEERAKGVID